MLLTMLEHGLSGFLAEIFGPIRCLAPKVRESLGQVEVEEHVCTEQNWESNVVAGRVCR